VTETVHVPPSVAPLRVGMRRNRSGSAGGGASGYRGEGEAGGLRVPPIALRDVLKVCIIEYLWVASFVLIIGWVGCVAESASDGFE
jgi:hypothetical protein